MKYPVNEPLSVTSNSLPRTLTWAIALGLSLSSGYTTATQWAPEELQFLPEFCKFTQGAFLQAGGGPTYEQYVKRYGDGWTHMHHYCNSVLYAGSFFRAKTPPHLRDTLADRAISEINYVLRHSPPDFALRPFLLTRKAEYQVRFRRLDEAITTAQEMTRAHPLVADGYALLAYLLRKKGLPEDANKAIRHGLDTGIDPASLREAQKKYDSVR